MGWKGVQSKIWMGAFPFVSDGFEARKPMEARYLHGFWSQNGPKLTGKISIPTRVRKSENAWNCNGFEEISSS